MEKPPNAHKTTKHLLTLQDPVYVALKISAEKKGLEPNEIICDLINKFVMEDGTLDTYTQQRIILSEELISQVVNTARRRCREGFPVRDITRDTIQECTDEKTFAEKYERYVEDNIYKHGNPLKAINREFGYRIRAALEATIMRDQKGRAISEKVSGMIIQSYTPFTRVNPKRV